MLSLRWLETPVTVAHALPLVPVAGAPPPGRAVLAGTATRVPAHGLSSTGQPAITIALRVVATTTHTKTRAALL